MKNVLKTIGKLYLLLTLVCLAVGCEDDKEDVAPGLYVANEEIETFPVIRYWCRERLLTMPDWQALH